MKKGVGGIVEERFWRKNTYRFRQGIRLSLDHRDWFRSGFYSWSPLCCREMLAGLYGNREHDYFLECGIFLGVLRLLSTKNCCSLGLVGKVSAVARRVAKMSAFILMLGQGWMIADCVLIFPLVLLWDIMKTIKKSNWDENHRIEKRGEGKAIEIQAQSSMHETER